MAVGQPHFPLMPPISGVQLGTSCAGIKQTLRDDLLIFEANEGATCAAVFTQNAFCAAPVIVAKNHLPQSPRWLLINSGNANAGTGEQGMRDAMQTCQDLANMTGGNMAQVLPFSTGVIGQALPIDKITSALPSTLMNLNEDNWQKAALAIMTTDTFPKGISKTIDLNGHKITINGISKGAGMIQPNMATMLGFIATDAKISHDLLQNCLMDATELSFNRITVDGDTSTNDACVILASGATHAPEILEDTYDYDIFYEAILEVCQELAELIIRDGEGATKLIRIEVSEAANIQEAVQVAKTIAHSPLVKTAFFASDPNWGRILAAVGRAGVVNMNLEAIRIYLDDVCIVREGGRANDYTEEAGQAVMDQTEIKISVKLGRGSITQTVLTCDFSYDYVKINAEYRT